MSVEVVYSPEWLRDLDAIWEWIAIEHGNPEAADRVIADLLDRIDKLAEQAKKARMQSAMPSWTMS